MFCMVGYYYVIQELGFCSVFPFTRFCFCYFACFRGLRWVNNSITTSSLAFLHFLG